MSELKQHVDTAIPLLETKLYAPRWHSGLISRQRLLQRLDQGAQQKLTLVSAPAGFGKSTLLAEWLSRQVSAEQSSAWVSLDESDNDPNLFWTYFLAAMERILPGGGAKAMSLLHSPQPAPIETILTALINAANQSPQQISVLLDDFHLIANSAIQDGIAFLLSHMPPNMRLIISTRSDPELPLTRLRAGGEMLELRATDLRFRDQETLAFLQESMGLNLSREQIAALESRTEGWIAGLQLAALSMQGRSDVDSFVAAFAGDDRYIIDYLMQEVLQGQTPEVRTFLLQTAILDRLSGPLCEAVTGQADCQQLLHRLERENLFIIPLDEKRQWYRYHHLFADMLLTRLTEEYPDQLSQLHIKAGNWNEGHGFVAKAIEHALLAGEADRAAELIEPLWAAMDKNLQSATWLKWASQLPEDIVHQRPVIKVGIAWAMLDAGQLDNVEGSLREVEQLLGKLGDNVDDASLQRHGVTVSDKKQFRYLPATIATARAYRSQALGDIEQNIFYTRQALAHLPEDDHIEYGAASALLGLGYWARGDLSAAYQTFSEVLQKFAKTDNTLLAIGPLFVLADIKATQGYLVEAVNQYRESQKRINALPDVVIPGTANLYLGLSAVYCERGDLSLASAELDACKALGDEALLPSNFHRVYTAQALLKYAAGESNEALELLNAAERVYYQSPMPLIQSFGALRTRIWLALDNLPEAMAWVRSESLSVSDELGYLREFDHITLAKVLVARQRHGPRKHHAGEALSLLQKLLIDAEANQRIGSKIDILITTALAYYSLGDMEEALPRLEQALDLAETQGYRQIFVSEGQPMKEVLRHAVGNGLGGDYARSLLAAFGDDQQQALAGDKMQLETPLTTREIEILRLIAAGMRNQEIADHLFISLYTVKRHIANAYAKLEVGHRTEAIARATELKLL